MSTRLVCTLRLVCGILLLFCFALTPREAEAIDTDVTVNDTRDLPDPSPNIGGCSSTAGTCTLRAAIQRANHRLTGTHIIRLPAGTFGLSRLGRDEEFADTGDLDIRGNIIIIGGGAGSTRINAFGIDRVFDVRTGSLLLQSLTVTNGHALEEGGGVRAKAPLTINRVHLLSNRADGDGGGVHTDTGLSVVRSTISNNQSGGAAGGIMAFRPISSLGTRTISIRESTISGNRLTPTVGIGGMEINGLYVVNISHSTIAFNDSFGLFVFLSVDLAMDHTILANHNEEENCFFIDSAAGARLNVDSDGSCGFSTSADNLILVDPQLSPLAANGGETPTHVFNSPVLADAGDPAGASCSGIDQRGLPRPVDFDGVDGARCDIGAIELQGPVGIAVLDPDHARVRRRTPFHLSYLWRVPPHQNWHDLRTLDLRIVNGDRRDKDRHHGDGDEVIFWVRWTEASNTFQLVNPTTGRRQGRAFPAGSNHVLRTDDVQLDLRSTSTQGSGPTGQDVTLHLTLIFLVNSERGEPFKIEVTGVDDTGQTQPFVALGSVAVRPNTR